MCISRRRRDKDSKVARTSSAGEKSFVQVFRHVPSFPRSPFPTRGVYIHSAERQGTEITIHDAKWDVIRHTTPMVWCVNHGTFSA